MKGTGLIMSGMEVGYDWTNRDRPARPDGQTAIALRKGVQVDFGGLSPEWDEQYRKWEDRLSLRKRIVAFLTERWGKDVVILFLETDQSR